MRRALALALTWSAVSFSAVADEGSSVRLRPFIGGGYTWGGDTIQSYVFIPQGSSSSSSSSSTTEYEEDVSGGAGLDLRLGLHVDLPDSPMSLQVSLIHHMDQHSGLDGKAYFRRTPIEVVGLWRHSDKLRFGIGVRKSVSAKFSSEGFTCGQDADGKDITCPSVNLKMKSNVGLLVEAEYLLTPDWGIKARYVRESYKFKDYPDARSISGDHIGFLTNYYFN